MKCSACANNECQGKYEYRYKCRGQKERIECSCYCKEKTSDVVAKTALSMEVGALAILGGLGVTLFTGGIGAVVVAGALFGSGTTLAASPLVKLANKESITLKNSVKDAAIGGTVGAVTGPVGTYLSSFAKGASVGTRITIHIASGSSGGAIKGTVTEGAKVVTGGEFSGMEFTKAVIFGGVVGGVCGAAQPIAHSKLLSPVTDVISKPAMRLLSSTGLSTASNVVVDVVKDGDVNGKVLAAKVVGSLITSSTKECNKACKNSKQQG